MSLEIIFNISFTKWKSQCAIANPLFGTTLTHAAALFTYFGNKEAKNYFKQLKENDVVIVKENSIVKNAVANGELKFGLTDTDDANVAMQEGKPVDTIFPNQKTIGTLLVPNTVSLIKNAPHPKLSKKLIDYILSTDVEKKLAYSKSAQIPVRKNIKIPNHMHRIKDIKTMEVDFKNVAEKLDETTKYLQKTFIK